MANNDFNLVLVAQLFLFGGCTLGTATGGGPVKVFSKGLFNAWLLSIYSLNVNVIHPMAGQVVARSDEMNHENF